jgi:NAD(P)-dependent dehydrogenase (short-subunit alcohol dehydrogenase family)
MAVASSETRFPTTPSLRLDGRRALVTGASKGLGRAIAIAFAEAGADVLLTARSLPEMEATVSHLKGRGLAARALPLDVTDGDAVRALVTAEGPFDILLNNAGTNIREPFLEVPEASLDTLLALNVRAAFVVGQAVAQGMVAAKKRGAIVNLSSVNGHVAGTNRSVYTATKFAFEGMTKAMAVELGPHGIRVNETPLTAGVLSDEAFMARTLRAIPLGRIGQVEDVMGAAVFLASDAAGLINGASLLIDGGMTCV